MKLEIYKNRKSLEKIGFEFIEKKQFIDNRGELLKTYDSLQLPNFHIKDQYMSISKKETIRGMHYQLGEYGQNKIINVLDGEIIDFGICIDSNSELFGVGFSIELNNNSPMIKVPKNFAHGFYSKTHNSKVLCSMDNYYNPKFEFGINVRSLQFFKDKIDLIISEKDKSLKLFNDNFFN